MDFLVQLLLAGLSVGGAYALIGLSLNLTFWTTKVLNFGQGAIMMLSAVLTVSFIQLGLHPAIALVFALLVAAICLYIIEEVGVKRMLINKTGSMGWVVSTLGAGIFIQGIASVVFGSQAIAFPDLIFNSIDTIEVAGAYLSLQYLAVFVIAVGAIILFEILKTYTPWGYSVRAVAHDMDLASVMGINSRRTIIGSFLLSGVLAGLAGILISQISGTVDPEFGLHLLVLSFVAAVLGGLGSAWGALAGGLLLGLLQTLVSGYISPSVSEIFAFSLLIVILSIRPQGLFGRKEVIKV